MAETEKADGLRRWRKAGLIVGLIGVACALVSACLSFTTGHYVRGFSTLGAGLVFGTIFISQFIQQRRNGRK